MRTWIILALSIRSLPIYAEPLPILPRIAVAPTVAVFDTTSERMTPLSVSRFDESDTTAGGTLSLGISLRVGRWIDVGVTGHFARFVAIDEESLSAMTIGPHVELRARRFYFRGDLGIGRISDNGVGSNGVRGGAELGYSTQVSSQLTLQMGLGTSAMHTKEYETHDDTAVRSIHRRRLLSAAVNCSFIFMLD